MPSKYTLEPLTKKQRNRTRGRKPATEEQIERSKRPARNKLIIHYKGECSVKNHRQSFRVNSEAKARKVLVLRNTTQMDKATYYDNFGKESDVLAWANDHVPMTEHKIVKKWPAHIDEHGNKITHDELSETI